MIKMKNIKTLDQKQYEIVMELGQGGQGKVLKVRDRNNLNCYAMK